MSLLAHKKNYIPASIGSFLASSIRPIICYGERIAHHLMVLQMEGSTTKSYAFHIHRDLDTGRITYERFIVNVEELYHFEFIGESSVSELAMEELCRSNLNQKDFSSCLCGCYDWPSETMTKLLSLASSNLTKKSTKLYKAVTYSHCVHNACPQFVMGSCGCSPI